MVQLRSTFRAPVDKPAVRAEQVPLIVPARAKSDVVEMPWIWKTLRERVYSRMPSYEQSKDFKLTLAPVVVTSPSDTVPGLGIAGDF